MKKILTIITLLLALSFSALATQPVKLGHINSTDLMRLMPELDSAEQQLQAFSRDYESEMRAMQTEYQNRVSEFEANQSQYSDLIRQARVRAIQDLGSRMEEYRQNAQEQFEAEQTKLMTPIIEKAREAISAVAKEHKYTYIFDSSVGALLYFGDSEDILELVKKKLDLK